MKKIEKINNNNNENTNILLCGLKREGEGRRGGGNVRKVLKKELNKGEK